MICWLWEVTRDLYGGNSSLEGPRSRFSCRQTYRFLFRINPERRRSGRKGLSASFGSKILVIQRMGGSPGSHRRRCARLRRDIPLLAKSGSWLAARCRDPLPRLHQDAVLPCRHFSHDVVRSFGRESNFVASAPRRDGRSSSTDREAGELNGDRRGGITCSDRAEPSGGPLFRWPASC